MLRIFVLLLLLLTIAACAPTQTRAPGEPGEAELKARYALQYLRQGKLQPARKEIETAMQLDPQLSSAKSIAALIYQSIGQPSKAQQLYEESLRLSPEDSATLNNYGKFLCSRGRLSEAENKFIAAGESPTNPHPEVAYANAGLCAKRIPDTDLAAQYFRAALDVNPDMPLALFQLAEINFKKKRYNLAAEELQRYQRVADHTPETLWLAIRNERARDNQPEVDRLTNQLSENFPNSEEARLVVAGETQEPVLQQTSVSDFSAATNDNSTSAPASSRASATYDEPGQVRDQRWLLQQPPENYTILLIRSQQKDQLFNYLKSDQLTEDLVYLSYRDGQDTWYSLLYGNFSNRSAAQNSISDLPVQLTESSPTIGRFGDFQQLLTTTY